MAIRLIHGKRNDAEYQFPVLSVETSTLNFAFSFCLNILRPSSEETKIQGKPDRSPELISGFFHASPQVLFNVGQQLLFRSRENSSIVEYPYFNRPNLFIKGSA